MVIFCLFYSDFFFFKQKTAYEMRISDWSSDVCSSDLRFVFLDEAAKRFIDNWPDRTKRLLAEFRLDYGRRFQDSTMTALVRELQGSSPEFSLWWGEHQVMEREGGIRRFDHQREGYRNFEQLRLVPTTDHFLKLV